jgi:hypothetical protein
MCLWLWEIIHTDCPNQTVKYLGVMQMLGEKSKIIYNRVWSVIPALGKLRQEA